MNKNSNQLLQLNLNKIQLNQTTLGNQSSQIQSPKQKSKPIPIKKKITEKKQSSSLSSYEADTYELDCDMEVYSILNGNNEQIENNFHVDGEGSVVDDEIFFKTD